MYGAAGTLCHSQVGATAGTVRSHSETPRGRALQGHSGVRCCRDTRGLGTGGTLWLGSCRNTLELSTVGTEHFRDSLGLGIEECEENMDVLESNNRSVWTSANPTTPL